MLVAIMAIELSPAFKTETETIPVAAVGGGQGSGKDTAAEAAAELTGQGFFETGGRYRFIGTEVVRLNPALRSAVSTPEDVFLQAVAEFSEAELHQMVREGYDPLIASGDKEAIKAQLYSPDASNAASKTAKSAVARDVVKDTLREDIRAAHQREESGLIVVGRQLHNVVNTVDVAQLSLNMYITCTKEEATRREMIRSNIDPHSERGKEMIALSRERDESDRNRPAHLDPVGHEAEVLDYNQLRTRGMVAREIGMMAAEQGLQLLMDTTTIPKGEMIAETTEVMNGALLVARRDTRLG